jgi:integrase
MRIKRLTALDVKRATARGVYPDGAGLYLQIAKNGSRSWVLRYRFAGKRRHLGLGAVELVGLAEARDRAQTARRQIWEGKDPVALKRQERGEARVAAAKSITVAKAIERYIAAHQPSWSSVVHQNQWRSSMARFVTPIIGSMPVSAVDTAAVRRVLDPIWSATPETANRVRSRLERVLDWARVSGFREDGQSNPARWRGHLDKLMPARGKLQKVEHYAAMPHGELPAFMASLRDETVTAARALEFLILTAARSAEVLGATWGEVDLSACKWTVPAGRMKAGEAHEVPLSADAVKLLDALPGREGLLFPGRKGKALPSTAMHHLLKSLDSGSTCHGFRATFRTWAQEQTRFPDAVAEMALAHAVGSAVQRAYGRSKLFEWRRELMESWGRYCGGEAATIRVLHAKVG